MLMTKERRSAIRTLRGWAISVLHEAGAIRECEEHGSMQDRADPHARERAFDIARHDPPNGLSQAEAIAEIEDVLASIGDTCPECPPDCQEAGNRGAAPAIAVGLPSEPLLDPLSAIADLLDSLFDR